MLYLSIRRLRLYFKENVLVSTLFIISGVLCVLTFLVLYGQYMPYMRVNSDMNMSYRYFYFLLKEPSSNYSALNEIFPTYNLESLMITTSETSSQEEIGFNIPVCTYLSDTPFVTEQLIPSHYRSSFSIENNSILIGQNYMNLKNGDVIKLKKSEYTITGRWNGIFLMVNPVVFTNSFLFSSITLRTSNLLSYDETQQLIEWVYQEYPVIDSRTPLDARQKAFGETPVSVMVMILFYVISLLSYLFLTSYLIYSQGTTNNIYRMIGLNNKKSKIIVMIDIIIVNIIMTTVAYAIHSALWKSVFKKINIWGTEGYSIADYTYIFVITISLSLLMFIPYALKHQNRSASLQNWED